MIIQISWLNEEAGLPHMFPQDMKPLKGCPSLHSLQTTSVSLYLSCACLSPKHTLPSPWPLCYNRYILPHQPARKSHQFKFEIIIPFQVQIQGLILLTLSTLYPSLHPTTCRVTDLNCLHAQSFTKSSAGQLSYLNISLLVVAVGSGGIKACIPVFGADQFDKGSPDHEKTLAWYFGAFFLAFQTGILIAITLVTYIQDSFGWSWGLGSLAMSMALAISLFFAGTPLYKHKLPSGSPLTRLAQVTVAGEMSLIPGCRKISHTEGLSFFDKAAVKTGLDHEVDGNWSLCSVTQVEELKAMVRLLPICSSGVIMTTTIVALVIYSTLEAQLMNRRLGNSFLLPAASVPVGANIMMMALVLLYELLFVPRMEKLTGNRRGITQLQRIGAGLVMSTFCMVVAGLIEHKRRRSDENMSVLILTAPHLIFVLSEVFGFIGLTEFLYSQAPEGMQSLAVSLLQLAGSLGSFLATFSVKIATNWLSGDLDEAHLDYYYWLLAVLNVFNFLVYLKSACLYKYRPTTKC